MLSRTHIRPRSFAVVLVPSLLLALCAVAPVRAQDDDNPKPEQHGRKYKAPPDTSHIEVTVLKSFNKKPIDGAHVILHSVKDGIEEGNLEIKTHPDGKATIDVIPTGSKVTIQVIADGFAPYAEDYQVNEESREIVISMIRPRAQISTYVDNSGKPSQMAPGVQEPVRPKKTPPASSSPGSTTPAPPATPDAASSTSSKPQP